MNKMAKKKTVVHLWIGQEGTACGKSHIGLDDKFIRKSCGDFRTVNCKKCLATSEAKTIKKMIGGYDVCAELRKIVKQVPRKDTVSMPYLPVSGWLNGTIEPHFEEVKIHKLLQFIADMIE